MDNEEQEKYFKAYYDNEADANKHMSAALLITGIMIIIIWIGYLTKVFTLTKETLLITSITLPISALILITPIFWRKTEAVKKPGFKYFVLYSFVLVMVILNIIMPKHAVLGWAVCIALTNHYYNPKVGRLIFISCAIMMLVCLYAGMFLGEFDSMLLSGQIDETTGLIHNYKLTETFVDSPSGRIQYVRALYQIGDNRMLKIILYYYLARIIFVSILFYVSNRLNKRTYKLLVDEIRVGNEMSKTKTELDVAKDIQLATLPTETISNKDIEIQAELRAAKEVGGDFYDYFLLDESHVGIVIGDVSGKGIPAAMFMMKTITCFKNYASIKYTPAETLQLVNKTIHLGNDSNMFVTCFYAIINTQTGEMVYANAGHNPPIIGQKCHYRYLECSSGFILGNFEKAFVKDERITLKSGDTITLYTDGITEAMNKKRELYGEARLLNLFNNKEYSCLIELHHVLKDDVMAFVKDAIQSDDMTYLTLKYHGDEYLYDEKTFDGRKENIPQMLDFLKTFAENKQFEQSFTNNLLVVGDELFSNIVKYGYKDSEGLVYIRLLYNLNNKEFIFTLIDHGVEFNPLTVNANPLAGDANDFSEGGLGILIVKSIMSDCAYDRIHDKNILILKKKFD